MSIKQSKSSLAKLLADNGDDDLIAHNKTKAFPPKAIVDTAAEEFQTPAKEAIAPPVQLAQREPQLRPKTHTIVSTASRPEELPVPVFLEAGPKLYRSQGLTIYESDDDLVDGFIDYLRKKKLRIGRKKGFSLFARAGLRALEDLRVRNPIEFEELLARALLEQR